MKRIFILFITILSFTITFSKTKKDNWNNIQVITLGVGVDGIKIVRVIGYGKKPSAALIDAQKKAIEAALFMGYPPAGGGAANATPPICIDKDVRTTHTSFFNSLFAKNGSYLKYITLSSDQTSNQVKIKKGYKITADIAVNYNKLREYLEEEKIIKKLGTTVKGASKPVMMVVPSERLCIEQGAYTDFDGQKIPNYRALLQKDNNLRLVITKMGGVMSDRGYPIKDLEQELNRLTNTKVEASLLTSSETSASIKESPIDKLKSVAQADIIVELDFKTHKKGFQNYVTFSLKGLDAYTSKQVAGAAGQGKPSSSANPPLLLEEAVLSHMDEFTGRLQYFFDDQVKNGREVSLSIRLWDDVDETMSTEVDTDDDTKELGDALEDWLMDNTVNDHYSVTSRTETQINVTARIPMTYQYRGKTRAMTARRFAANLRSYIRDLVGIDAKIYTRGLGEVWLILGEQ